MSKALSSPTTAVMPSSAFNSAAVEVTPSSMFNSAVVEVTPSNMFNSAAVDVTAVLPKVSPLSGITTPLPDKAVKVFAVNLKSSAPAILISIWSSVSAVILVSASSSKINSSPFKSVAPPKPASITLVPLTKTSLVPLSDAPKVTPVPDAVLNWTVWAPDVEFFTTYIFSKESGIVTIWFPEIVPVNSIIICLAVSPVVALVILNAVVWALPAIDWAT